MAFQTIKLKNTNVAGNVPAADKLATAELVINLKDKKLFSKDADGAVFELNSASTTPGPLPPNDKQPGDLWFNENDNSLNYWDGVQWVQLEGSTGSPGVQQLLAGDNITLDPADGVNTVKITAADAPVTSVNGETGIVVLDAADVGALPDTTPLEFVPLGSWSEIPALV